MRVFGIDCGTEFTGYGVVEVDCQARMPRLIHLAAGTIRLSKKEKPPQRLAQVYAELTALIALHQPEIVAIEEVFFSANVKSALKLGQVRGVAMLAAASCGLSVAEYAPLSIKSSVVGYGLAVRSKSSSWCGVFLTTRMPSIRRTQPTRWPLRSVTSTLHKLLNYRAREDEICIADRPCMLLVTFFCSDDCPDPRFPDKRFHPRRASQDAGRGELPF